MAYIQNGIWNPDNLPPFWQKPFEIWDQSYEADFGITCIKNGFNKLNFTLNYINFDVIYTKKVLGLTPGLNFNLEFSPNHHNPMKAFLQLVLF